MSANDAYEQLGQYWLRAKNTARGLPAQQKMQAYWKGVGFSVAEYRFVSALGTVSEILNLPSFARIPRVKPWVLGVANVRGRLVPMIDLAIFLQLDAKVTVKKRRLLVVEDHDYPVGLVVDDLLGMQQLAEDRLQSWEAPADSRLVDYVQQAFADDPAWLWFDVRALVQSSEFRAVSLLVTG